jgi:hypothetical protein
MIDLFPWCPAEKAQARGEVPETDPRRNHATPEADGHGVLAPHISPSILETMPP